MQLRDVLGLLTETTAIANLTGTEMVMLSLPDSGQSDDLELTRVDLASVAVLEAANFAHYQQDLPTVLAEIMLYAEEHGFDNAKWEQLSI